MNSYGRLTLLGVLHYVLAGLTALAGCVPLVYAGLGLMILGGRAWSAQGQVPPDVGWMFVGLGTAGSVLAWAVAAALAACGYYLRTQRHHTFCLVVAVVECLNMPLGTILGVFTIVTLVDPKAKAMFERGSTTPEATEPA